MGFLLLDIIVIIICGTSDENRVCDKNDSMASKCIPKIGDICVRSPFVVRVLVSF